MEGHREAILLRTAARGFKVFTAASLSPVGRRGRQGDRSSSADTSRFYPEVCWEPLISSPGPTQNSPSLFIATNHLGVSPVRALRRQTVRTWPQRSSASTARSVSTATPRGAERGAGPFQKSARGRTGAFRSLVPLRCRRFTSGSCSREENVVFCAESEGLTVSLFMSLF